MTTASGDEPQELNARALKKLHEVIFVPTDESPWNLTSVYIRKNYAKMGMDAGIVDLVCALLDTGILYTTYSCEGHFTLQQGHFNQHNEIAQVRFYAKDLGRVTALCEEILRTVNIEDIDIRATVNQLKGRPDEPIEIEWDLEFRPEGFWDICHARIGMTVSVADGWSEKRARALLQKAFKQTIRVCERGRWRKL